MKLPMMRAALAAGLVAAVAGAAWAQGAATTITTRQDTLKAIAAATGEVKKVMDAGGDLTTVVAKGQEVADGARKLQPLFPAGTGPETGVKTRALPAIWQDKSDFDAKMAALVTEADKLVAVLRANDKAGIAAQFAATTATCGACHRPYRAPQ